MWDSMGIDIPASAGSRELTGHWPALRSPLPATISSWYILFTANWTWIWRQECKAVDWLNYREQPARTWGTLPQKASHVVPHTGSVQQGRQNRAP